jgi:uncharacterized protein YbjT (DUF2867 family)
LKIIITGATGFVGEGVLIECLKHPDIEQILMINRKSCKRFTDTKLKECILTDFFDIDDAKEQLSGYDACFYCAGKSSVGMNEQDYSHITYDMLMYVANTLLIINPGMIFCHISGAHTDSTENGKIMWARVKGKAENALMKLPFGKVYNFRPGIMKATKGQHNVKFIYKILYPLVKLIYPRLSCTLRQVGLAMINSALKGYPKQILEVKDIILSAGE